MFDTLTYSTLDAMHADYSSKSTRLFEHSITAWRDGRDSDAEALRATALQLGDTADAISAELDKRTRAHEALWEEYDRLRIAGTVWSDPRAAQIRKALADGR